VPLRRQALACLPLAQPAASLSARRDRVPVFTGWGRGCGGRRRPGAVRHLRVRSVDTINWASPGESPRVIAGAVWGTLARGLHRREYAAGVMRAARRRRLSFPP